MSTRSNPLVTLNVGGKRHQVFSSTLENIPNTKLSNLKPTDCDKYFSRKNEYFFDRNSLAFEHILNFYRTGKLHIGRNLCSEQVKSELDFWGIHEHNLDSCCWLHYKFQEQSRLGIQDYEKARLQDHIAAKKHLEPHQSTWEKCRSWVWAMLDIPASCTAAKIYCFISILITVLLITLVCVETLPEFADARLVMVQTVRASLKEIAMLILFMGITCVMFGVWIYFFEKNTNPEFTSIPGSFWWVIVTMTTVGYGDVVPISAAGKLLGGLCAVSGVILVALTVPIIVKHFTDLYQMIPIDKDIQRLEVKNKMTYAKVDAMQGIHTTSKGVAGSTKLNDRNIGSPENGSLFHVSYESEHGVELQRRARYTQYMDIAVHQVFP